MRNQKVYGYVRVSARDQNEARQMIALKEAEVPARHIYIDRQSGKDFDRPQYKRLLDKLNEGDVLFIKSIDRLGRNYTDLTEQWRIITKEKRVDIVVLDMPLLDTRWDKDLLRTLINDLVLTLLSYVAENERANIRQRQAEGIAAAKGRGAHLGRPPRSLPDGFSNILRRWLDGELTVKEAAQACGLPPSTFHDRARRAWEAWGA